MDGQVGGLGASSLSVLVNRLFCVSHGEVVVDRALSFGWRSNRRRVGGESHWEGDINKSEVHPNPLSQIARQRECDTATNKNILD